MDAAAPPRARGPRIRLCRGCCCGTERKHPGIDHEGIARALEEGVGSEADVVRVDCLWACDLSSVVVVNPAPEARSTGTRPAWIPEVNTVERARAVAEWVRRGGPGVVEPPSALGEIHTAAGLRRTSNAGW